MGCGCVSLGGEMSEINGEVEEIAELAAQEGETISYTASLVRQGRYRFYTLTMPAEMLAETCTVDRRIENPMLGFQRRLDLRRAREIANYIDSGLGTIPGSVILSAQPDANFKYDSAKRTISFRKIPRAFFILDGQHRVYGFTQARNKRLRVPVVIYEGLQTSEEVTLFMDINTKQRQVPNELLLDIKNLARSETNEEAKLRTIYDLCNKSTDSPLYGLMSPSEKAEGKLSRVTFNAALKAVFRSFGDADAERIYEVLRNYLNVWVTVLYSNVGSAELITNPTLFRAMLQIFPFVVGRVSDRFGRQFTAQNFEEILRPLGKLRKSDLQRPGASHPKLAEGFRRRLEAGFSIDGSVTI
jgi:DGQHR domain-containing protein